MPGVLYTVFPPGKPLKWSPDFAPFEMKRLFEDRERLFALQRKLDQPDSQKRAEEAVRGHEASLAKMRRNVLLSYRRFCTAANIPPWPVTDPIRALCVVAKFSGGSYGYRSLWGLLSTLANMTGAFFRSEPAYIELLSLKAPSQAAFKTKDVTILDSGSSSEDGGSSGGSASDGGETTTKMTSLQPNPTNQSFTTLNDALVACAIPLIKTYGYSARIERVTETSASIYCNRHNSYYNPRCRYHWALTYAEGKRAWFVDSANSELSHNHGITPEIAKDPTWRPRLHNLVVKKALELADAPSSQAIGKRANRTDSTGRARPNARPDSGAAEENEIVASQAAPKRLKANKLQPTRPPPMTAPAEGGPTFKPDTEAATQRLAAFFAAREEDHHLVPLAAAFVNEGLQTLEDLTMFACLDPAIRNTFIGAVQKIYA